MAGSKLTKAEWRMLSGLAVRSRLVGYGDDRAVTLITRQLATRSTKPGLLIITDAGRSALKGSNHG